MKTQTELRAEAELMILHERQRQTAAEGYDAQHDDRHRRGEIGLAAHVYFDSAMLPGHAEGLLLNPQRTHGIKWPWDWQTFKPWAKREPGQAQMVDSERCLVKAGALLRAEQDRLLRLERKIVASLQSVLDAKQRRIAHEEAIQFKPGARGLADS